MKWIGLAVGAWLSGGFGLALAAWAAEPAPRGVEVSSVQLPGESATAPGRNPVEFFRQLMGLEEAALETALAGRSENQRRFLAAKAREYAAMPPAERELKLRLMELHWRAAALLRAKPNDREGILAAMPAADRAILGSRLAQWDTLPPPLRENLLTHDTGLQDFLQLGEAVRAESGRASVAAAPGATADELEAQFERWQGQSREALRELRDDFLGFFDLAPDQRRAAIERLPGVQRAAMERSLAVLEKLSAEEREMCLNALERLADMAPEERRAYWANVARWRQMSVEERTLWRRVAGLPPPRPPGLGAAGTGIGD